jgi:hypothetical protein
VQADLAGDSVTPSNGPTSITRTYYHALAEGDIKRYRTELGLLQDVQTRSPFHAYIKGDVTNTQTAILSGQDQTPLDLASYAMASPISAGGVIALAVIVWLASGIVGRVRKPRVEPVAPTPVPTIADVVRESEPIAGNGVPHPPSPPPGEPAETQQT